MSQFQRDYRIHGGGTFLHIQDEATPYVSFLVKRFPDLADRALRHVGHWLQGTVKAEMRAGAPGGSTWPDISGISRFRVIDYYRGTSRGKRDINGNLVLDGLKRRRRRVRRTGGGPAYTKLKWRNSRIEGKTAFPSAGSLTQAVGYEHKQFLRVGVGWLSPSSAKLGYWFQAGKKTTVSPRMRRFFAAAGVPLSKGKAIVESPPRPVFSPVFARHGREIPRRFEERIWHYLNQDAKGIAG